MDCRYDPSRYIPDVSEDLADVVPACTVYGEHGIAMVPLIERRDKRPSVFMWTISASMALRRGRLAISFGVSLRRVPLITTRLAATR